MKQYLRGYEYPHDLPDATTSCDVGYMIRDPNHIWLFGIQPAANGVWIDTSHLHICTFTQSPMNTPIFVSVPATQVPSGSFFFLIFL